MSRECRILNVLIIDTARRIIDCDPRVLVIKKFQLLTPLKQFAGELLSDERNAEALGRLVEHGKTNILLLLSLLTHLKVYSRALQQMMQFSSS